jgi:hypothetical protein
MSFLSTIAGVVPALIGFAGRMLGLKPVEPVPLIAPTHYFPADNTPSQWEVGTHRCYWCLRYDIAHQEITTPPCTRRRPGGVELA